MGEGIRARRGLAGQGRKLKKPCRWVDEETSDVHAEKKGRRNTAMLIPSILPRSLLYVEGNCTMNKFQDKEGNQQSAMSIVQRTFTPFLRFFLFPPPSSASQYI